MTACMPTRLQGLQRPVRQRLGTAVLVCAFAAPWSAVSMAQTGAGAAPGAASPSSGNSTAADMRARKAAHADAGFMKQAAENNHAEVESGKLALEKASDPKIKAFAQKMVDDHGAKGKELMALAASKGVELPDGPSVMQKGKLKLLGTSKGESFDRRYAQTMGVTAHEDTIALFRQASTGASDPEVKAFATKTLPALEHHLEMARALPGAQDKEEKGARR